jgi:hypothetical protein
MIGGIFVKGHEDLFVQFGIAIIGAKHESGDVMRVTLTAP